jgi:hypothetical protein
VLLVGEPSSAASGPLAGNCSWQEGLVVHPELADGIAGIDDVARQGLRLVSREPGAEDAIARVASGIRSSNVVRCL